jgi:hypothetical protein
MQKKRSHSMTKMEEDDESGGTEINNNYNLTTSKFI